MRFVNSLLQFKLKAAGTELTRFCINTTIGGLGFSDPAKKHFGLKIHREDFRQTLGFYGVRPGIFVTWPLFGPSSARDTLGIVPDILLGSIFPSTLDVESYEMIKRDSLDPYVGIRNVWYQNRESIIKQ